MRAAKSTTPRRAFLTLLALLSVTVFVIGALELAGVTHLFHKQQVAFPSTPTSGGASASNPKGESNTAPPQSNPATQPGDNKSSTGGDTSTTLIAPTGDFVSAHTVHMNSQLASVCNTTPGATCQIIFTKDTSTISLATQTTDRAGSTYWGSWTPQNVGLSVGSWQITASATLNEKTVSSADSKELVVSP